MDEKCTLIIGTGKTCQSCIDYFHKNNIRFKIFDTRDVTCIDKSIIAISNKHDMRFVKYEKEFLNNVEEAIISPGLDSNQEIIKDLNQRSIPIITDIDLFKRLSRRKIISVTGTNGKTTIVTMLEYLLNRLGIKAKACGNNGISPFLTLDEEFNYIILELSSYQLEYMTNLNSNISLISNIQDDHLERHNNFDNYLNTKKKIFNSTKINICHNNLIEYMKDIPNIRKYGFENTNTSNSYKIYINNSHVRDLRMDKTKLYYEDTSFDYRGIHNLDNILAVLSITKTIYDKNDFFKKSINILKKFNHLPHRIQLVKKINDVSYFNDSKSTNVFSTITALKYLKKNIILIMGGSKKNLDYTKLNIYIDNHVKLLILFGENKKSINKQIVSKAPRIICNTINESVQISYNNAIANDIVLLSPGSPSFDMFESFKERGIAFMDAVNDLDQ
tara:strand:+ start:38420 stop:39754 length:1335 start_codon:yes stop_codon:yes gene_type:complete